MIRQTWLGRLHHDVTHRGVTAWLLALVLTGFYVALYFTEWLAPVAVGLGLGNKWTLYGLLYTVAVTVGGVNMLGKYRHNRYQVVRTVVVMGTQIVLAFAAPLVLKLCRQPEFYFSYFWPLKMEYLTPGYLLSLPWLYVVYSIVGALVVAPLLGVVFGKRWYCSWICGCGGLANTFGEPWRALSDKSSLSWRVERVTIHSVLGLSIGLTVLLWVSWWWKPGGIVERAAVGLQTFYGLWVSAVLAGVVGVGLYPLGGTRVWCRFFCPMAALLGIVQKAGRFRIRVKEDMCISCGMCSKYCEMGIDVRAYAQRNESFTRSSCVGCGMCAEVCPRGVLRLENDSGLIQIGSGWVLAQRCGVCHGSAELGRDGE